MNRSISYKIHNLASIWDISVNFIFIALRKLSLGRVTASERLKLLKFDKALAIVISFVERDNASIRE